MKALNRKISVQGLFLVKFIIKCFRNILNQNQNSDDMAKFTSYRRIGNFVIETRLDHMSNELNTTCIIYYALPNKELTKIYHLSKVQREVDLDIQVENRKYFITGRLEFHFRHIQSSEIVNIYARLNYGTENDAQNYEGVLTQIDSNRGNLLEGGENFPNINNLHSSPNDY